MPNPLDFTHDVAAALHTYNLWIQVGVVLTHFALEINGMSIAAHLLFSISANLILAHHNFYIKLCFLCIRDEDHKGNCSITNMKYGT